jgi:hypothetical protein
VGRIIGIIVVLVLVVAGAGYFLVPPVAARSQTVEIERPAQTVLARLASTPANTVVVEGVTTTEAASQDGDTVTAPVSFADGAAGRVVYTVTPAGEGARVQVKLEQNLGSNPLDRLQIITGGDVAPLIEAAATSVSTDLTALPDATFDGLVYVVEEVQARPFFYWQDCVDTEPETISTVIADAKLAIEPLMRQRNVQASGPLIAVEPQVEPGQYCFQIGYPFTGRAPGSALAGRITSGQTPAGQVLHMHYTGSEADVMAQVYNRMDALLGAARLDRPGESAEARQDDWTTYEVYNDDPTQPGGSRDREIYYVVPAGVDITAVTALAAPAQSLTPAAAPAETPAAGATTAPATPAPSAPAPTP